MANTLRLNFCGLSLREPYIRKNLKFNFCGLPTTSGKGINLEFYGIDTDIYKLSWLRFTGMEGKEEFSTLIYEII